MSAPFQHLSVTLTGVAPARLRDTSALAAALVAAAGAIGLANDVPPLVRGSAGAGGAVGALSPDGHIVLHTAPDQGVCLVDVVTRTPAPARLGLEVIARRLGARLPDAEAAGA